MRILLHILIYLPLMILTACQKENPDVLNTKASPGKESSNLTISKISWRGNTKHTAEELNTYLRFKAGDTYKRRSFQEQLTWRKDRQAVANLYMNQGHFFFETRVIESFDGDRVSLEIVVNEGKLARLGNVDVKISNSDKDLQNSCLQILEVKAGDLFNLDLLLLSVEKLAESVLVNPNEIHFDFSPYSYDKDAGTNS